MATKLLIVESPAKAKTINKYLGNDFIVIASFGHVRDLPKKAGSIDINNNFEPKYQIIIKNKKHVDEILKHAKECDVIYIATDPDREGEAIAWHIQEILKQNKLTNKKNIKRVTFNEITKSAINDAIKSAHSLDMNLVQAQQARLTLDYLLGFNLSPLLWRKIKTGLSAGRVQSPALRLICERETEIKAFVPQDYFIVLLHTSKDDKSFVAKLIEYENNKIELRTISQKKQAEDICTNLAFAKNAVVAKVVKKQKKKNPLPPFITSSLQIEAARTLGFNTDKTMRIAQSLYEGVEIGNESTGLITYMRTDSVNLSSQAIEELREYIKNNFDKKYLPKTPVMYTSKVKNAQEAHEAIRPTSIERTPKSLKNYLSLEQYKLYELIWLRTLSSQLASAILDTTAVDIKVKNAIFRINGVIVNFDGYMKIYDEIKDDVQDDENISDNQRLPELNPEDQLEINKINFSEHQTEAKPRYSEASLVKSLEELGIGRPSTYASIISTLKKREYVEMDKKRFIPTDIGLVVSQFLTNHFFNYVDYKFTASLEDTLDDISNGTIEKLPILQKFWHELDAKIKEKQDIPRADLVTEKLEEECPKCGKQLIIRLGKYGKFIGCSGYPDCNYMRKIEKDGSHIDSNLEPEEITDRVCPKDGGILVIRNGRYGKFISCKNYPKCKYIESLQKVETLDNVKCPNCDTGYIVAKKNRFGNWFYACNNYPQCKTIFNHKPILETCPNCKYKILLHKITKRYGEEKVCPNCEFKEKLS